MIPSANRANCESAPPEKTLSRPRMVLPRPLKYVLIVCESTPGAGIHDQIGRAHV